LHTDPLPKVYEPINHVLNQRFMDQGDPLRDAAPYIGQLLDRGVRVLLYAGQRDVVGNWVGNLATAHGLAWYGAQAFNSAPEQQWEVDGKIAGMKKAHDLLAFVRVDGAGHMAPYDKPRESLELVRQWLEEKL
jgi:carboxypeptidase C (cathepsin A)